MWKDENLGRKLMIAGILLVIAVLSITVVSDYTTSPKVHASTMKVLDDKKAEALGLTASVAAVSALISALPGDTATPIAQQIAELSNPLLVVVCAIYLEKFLLTTLGYLSFNLLIPASCVLGSIYLFYRKEIWKILAIKISVFAIAVYVMIPFSVKVITLMEATFEESISQTFDAVDELSGEEEKANSDSTKDTKKDGNAITDFFTNLSEKTTELGEKAAGLSEKAKNALNVFIDAIAVLIITTCAVPIAVIFFFIWITKLIFGFNIDVSNVRRQMFRNKEKPV